MKTKASLLAPGVIFIMLALPVQALEVYQWTDENGVVHFSQWAPDQPPENFETVRVDGGEGASNGLGISESDDPDGYQAHREQMDALRAEMEARRAAERDRQEQASNTEYIYVQQENPYPYAFPGYGYRPPHRPGRPPNRPKPLPAEPENPPASVVRPATLKRP